MNVSELYSLTTWINKEIVEAQVPQKYQALQVVLQQQIQPNQKKQPFESQKEDLLTTLKKIPISKLTRDQIAFIEHLGLADLIGESGVEIIEDIFYKNVLDLATTNQKLSQMLQHINAAIDKSNQLRTGLKGCLIEEEYETENEILMRVTFTGDALMKNITDFKLWGAIWYDIGRGVAMANDLSPEAIKVVGATKGSIVIELAVAATIATTTSTIILSALKVAEKVIDIRKKAAELRALQLQNSKLIKDLEKEADNEKNAGIEQITKELSEQLQIGGNGDGDKVQALDKSVKKLVDFIEKGGVVDFLAPNENDSEEENHHQELNIAFEEIRRLEKKIELLEHHKSD